MFEEWDIVLFKRIRMRRVSIWPSLILYIGATATFLFLLFLFFDSQGLSWQNLWIAMAIFVPAIGTVGYLILSDLAENKQKQDERLEHMAREVLHEINLPISTIETNMQLLRKGLRDEKAINRAQRVVSASHRLRRLYELLMYRITSEIKEVEKETFDLSKVVAERVSLFEEIGRNGFEFDLSSANVHLDRIGLEQVLDNILENSIKYSHPKQPIEVRLHDAVLSIEDHGKGMDSTEIARIYERYYQGDIHSQGEGIGLALVKRYCDESKVGIKISSKPGRGTIVELDFAQVIQK